MNVTENVCRELRFNSGKIRELVKEIVRDEQKIEHVQFYPKSCPVTLLSGFRRCSHFFTLGHFESVIF